MTLFTSRGSSGWVTSMMGAAMTSWVCSDVTSLVTLGKLLMDVPDWLEDRLGVDDDGGDGGREVGGAGGWNSTPESFKSGIKFNFF